METLYELEKSVRAQVRDEIDLEDAYPEDRCAEIADSNVPIYTADILAMAADRPELATEEPECGPAFDGSPTPTNIIAANIYEALSIAAHDELRQMQEGAEEEQAIRDEIDAGVRTDDDGNEIVEMATCGGCGRSWNDAAVSGLTPTPSGRCPFEYLHTEVEA